MNEEIISAFIKIEFLVDKLTEINSIQSHLRQYESNSHRNKFKLSNTNRVLLTSTLIQGKNQQVHFDNNPKRFLKNRTETR